MEDKIAFPLITLVMAMLFFGIGIYARLLTKPMWFWSGSTVKEQEITDIPAYNKANSRMWMLYSMWFWVSGILYFWFPVAAVIVMVVGSTAGMVPLIICYNHIYRKYKK